MNEFFWWCNLMYFVWIVAIVGLAPFVCVDGHCFESSLLKRERGDIQQLNDWRINVVSVITYSTNNSKKHFTNSNDTSMQCVGTVKDLM